MQFADIFHINGLMLNGEEFICTVIGCNIGSFQDELKVYEASR